MPRLCTVCHHAARSEIEYALASGTSHRKVAEQYGLSASAVFRHQKKHPQLAPAAGLEERVAKLESLTEQMASWIGGLADYVIRLDKGR